MVGLQDFVSVGEAIAYCVFLFGQKPQTCSGFERAEKRWATIAVLNGSVASFTKGVMTVMGTMVLKQTTGVNGDKRDTGHMMKGKGQMKPTTAIVLTTVTLMTLGAVSHAADGLNGAAGKLFDVNLKDKSFRFLKQDVKYDPKTGEGTAWHTAYWTDSATFRQYEERPNLSGIKGPVIAVFSGFDDAATKAVKAGQSFRADKVVLRPDLKKPTGISADGQTVVGWFTPRQARFSRDGTLKLGDRQIDAGVKRGGIRITVEQEHRAEDLTKGFWKATLEGKESDGGFIVAKLMLQRLVDPLSVDDPLPRVLVVGDSISMNYHSAAKEALKGIANYHRIEDNCWSTVRCVAFMAYWLGDYSRKGLHWDVIQFNSGLHDMKQKTLGGDYAVAIDDYKSNLRKQIEIMKKTGATLIWCSTTPVPNDLGSPRYAYRSKGSERDFNKAAMEVMREYPEIQVNDLCKVVNESSMFDAWRKRKDVHFWKSEEQAVLGKAVADAVIKALKSRKTGRK